MQINVESGVKYINQYVTTQDETTEEEEEFEQSQPDSEMDWDSDENWQRRFWARIMEEKKQRERDILLMEEQRQELEEERGNLAQVMHSIDQRNHDLEVRENKLLEIEPFIPLARQLQAMKIDITNFLPWVESVHEYAVTRDTDLTTAAYNLAHDLREYRQLGSLQKCVEQAKQQLTVLEAFTAQMQAAITTVMNLQLAGFSEKDIHELIGLVNMWNKHSSFGFGLGLNQGNGSGGGNRMNGSKLDVDWALIN
jgi:hypothetical protein